MLAQNRGRGEGFHSRHVTGAGHHHVRLMAHVAARPIPNANAFRAVLDGRIHVEVLQVRLLVGHNHVDVLGTAQAVIGYAQQAVGVGRQIDADDLRTFVGDDVQKAGILMGEAIVILPPDKRGDEQVERGYGSAPSSSRLRPPAI